jgi:ABC-2 type transport system permease protein
MHAEWLKIRTVRSSFWTLGLLVLLTVGLAVVTAPLEWEEDNYDPGQMTYYGINFTQLALIAFGILTVTNEYASGMIHNSLAAVPDRRRFLLGKLAVGTAVAFAASVVTAVGSQVVGLLMIRDDLRMTAGEAVRTTVGACLYLTLLCLISMCCAVLLRTPVLAMSVLMPMFFIVSTVLEMVVGVGSVFRYLPDRAGRVAWLTDSRFMDDGAPDAREGLLIMGVWAGALVMVAMVFLRRRDA